MSINKHLNLLNYGTQNISRKDIDQVIKVLNSSHITTGPLIKKFEKKLSSKLGKTFVTSCSSGTAALHLACLVLGIKKDDFVIIPSITFLATANSASFCGANVFFCDVSRHNGLMEPEHLEQAIKNCPKKPKAVFVVHLAGQPVNLYEISKITRKYRIEIIEDGCHALGTTYSDKNGNHKIGDCYYSKFTTFSFHSIKNITTGEGGCVTTKSERNYKTLNCLRSHGMIRENNSKSQNKPWFYKMDILGYNYRLTDFQAALGVNQIERLDKFKKHREKLKKKYDYLLEHYKPLILPIKKVKNCSPCWHLYSVLIDFKKIKKSKSEVMYQLKNKGIGSQVHYIPIHTQPYYKNKRQQSLQGSEHYYLKTLSLPLHTKLEERDIEYVIKELIKILKI